jgi:hypothetical protein
MPSILFFRATNVGGHQVFRPGALAKELAEFDIVNIGAAGTWVVRKAVSQAALRAAVLRRLEFKPELLICSAREVLDLASDDPFAEHGFSDEEAIRVIEHLASGHPDAALTRQAAGALIRLRGAAQTE